VDPHKSVNAVWAIDENGELLAHEAFPADRKGLRALERWSKRFPERRWAVEGAAGIGRPVAQKLLAVGEEVADMPPKLSAKVRVLSVGNARKNDRLDATFTALAALGNERLAAVRTEDGPEGRSEVLRLLTGEWRLVGLARGGVRARRISSCGGYRRDPREALREEDLGQGRLPRRGALNPPNLRQEQRAAVGMRNAVGGGPMGFEGVGSALPFCPGPFRALCRPAG